MTARPQQRIFVIRRRSDGLFLHCGKQTYTETVNQALIVSKTKFKGVIRVDLGRDLDDFEMVEVVPALQ